MFYQPTYIHLPQTDSTNNYAQELIKQNLAQNAMVISTDCQTQGKGQFGKTWEAEPKKNVTFSLLLLVDEMQLLQPFVLLAKVALGVKQAVQNELQDETVFIKWMNDIYCNDKKAAGILIETVNHPLKPKLKWVIIGVGVNVNQTQFGDLQHKAVSLKQLTNLTYNIDALLQKIVSSILNKWEEKNEGKIVESYNNHLYKKNLTVRFKKGNIAFEAIIQECDVHGNLIVGNSIWDKFAFGEVVWEG